MLGPLDELARPPRRVIRFVAGRRPPRGDRADDPDGGRLPRALDDGPHPAARPRSRTPRTPPARWSSSTAPSRPASSICTSTETGADFYAISGQKWLLGPQRHGGAVGAPAPPRSPAAGAPELSDLRRRHRRERCGPGAARFDPGHARSRLAGRARRRGRVGGRPGGRLAGVARAGRRAGRDGPGRLAAAGIPAVDPPGGSTGLVAFELPGHEPADVVAGARRARRCSCGHIPDTPYLRLSVGAWTSDADLDALIDGPRGRPRRRLKHLVP